jgi:hypothetical protein
MAKKAAKRKPKTREYPEWERVYELVLMDSPEGATIQIKCHHLETLGGLLEFRTRLPLRPGEEFAEWAILHVFPAHIIHHCSLINERHDD